MDHQRLHAISVLYNKVSLSEIPIYISYMDDKKSIRCTVSCCKDNVPYIHIHKNISSSRAHTKVCDVCKKKRHPDDMASGLFEHCCFQCSCCDQCGRPQWDYVCGYCSGYCRQGLEWVVRPMHRTGGIKKVLKNFLNIHFIL